LYTLLLNNDFELKNYFTLNIFIELKPQNYYKPYLNNRKSPKWRKNRDNILRFQPHPLGHVLFNRDFPHSRHLYSVHPHGFALLYSPPVTDQNNGHCEMPTSAQTQHLDGSAHHWANKEQEDRGRQIDRQTELPQ